jgi:hypothetical protein
LWRIPYQNLSIAPVREGTKKQGKWEGEAIYTFTEGPRAGKRYE